MLQKPASKYLLVWGIIFTFFNISHFTSKKFLFHVLIKLNLKREKSNNLLVKLLSYNLGRSNILQNNQSHSYLKSTNQQDVFKKTNQVSFTGYPKFLLFEDVAKLIGKGDLEAINKLPDLHIISPDLKSLLHISTEEKQIEISKTLLAKGLNVNQKDKMGKTPLAVACLNQDEAHFNLFLNFHPNIKTQDNAGNTLLHNSIHNQKILGTLLDRGANPYTKNNFGLPVLHEVSEDLDTLEYLLKRGINPDSMNDEEQTLLHTASIDGNKKLSDMLLNYSAEKDFRDKCGKSPLFYSNDNNMVKYWIEKKVKLDIQDKEGKTALHHFVIKRDFKSVLELLKRGSNPNTIDITNKSPILYADNNAIRKLLLEAGADPNIRTTNGSTLLHKSVQKNNEEITDTLIKYKADPNALDKNNKAPLYYAQNNTIRKKLLENGADPNEKLYLHYALRTNNEEFFNDLLKTEIDVNIEDHNSKTPIFYCKKAEDAFKLVKKDAYINYQDDNGNTPLHQYYATGNIELVEALKKLGANEQITNIKGELPHEFAEKFKKYDCWIK